MITTALIFPAPRAKPARVGGHTLSMALLGIVEKNERRFNGGLAAQLEFYEPEAIHGEEQDTSEEFICDPAVALANLGTLVRLEALHQTPLDAAGLAHQYAITDQQVR